MLISTLVFSFHFSLDKFPPRLSRQTCRRGAVVTPLDPCLAGTVKWQLSSMGATVHLYVRPCTEQMVSQYSCEIEDEYLTSYLANCALRRYDWWWSTWQRDQTSHYYRYADRQTEIELLAGKYTAGGDITWRCWSRYARRRCSRWKVRKMAATGIKVQQSRFALLHVDDDSEEEETSTAAPKKVQGKGNQQAGQNKKKNKKKKKDAAEDNEVRKTHCLTTCCNVKF